MKTTHSHQPWLIIANGKPMPKTMLQQLAHGKNILVLDGAYQHAIACGLQPDILLGDFDSISESLLTQARTQTNTQVLHTPDQNYTDLEKGIQHLDSLQASHIEICSAVGSRLDHSLFNLRILKRHHQHQRRLRIYSPHEVVCYLEDETMSLNGEIGQGIGILGAPDGYLSSEGLKYDVQNYRLAFADASSICNQFASEQITVTIEGGALCIIQLPISWEDL